MAASARLLPGGVLTLKGQRQVAIAALFLLAAAYFGVGDVITIVIDDALGGSVASAGGILTVGALCWALASLLQARIAGSGRTTPRARLLVGVALLVAGFSLLVVAVAIPSGGTAQAAAIVGWSSASLGMGVIYPELLGVILDERDDGITVGAAASAGVLAESLGGSLGGAAAGTLISAWVGARSGPSLLIVLFAVFLVLGVLIGALSARVGRAEPGPTGG